MKYATSADSDQTDHKLLDQCKLIRLRVCTGSHESTLVVYIIGPFYAWRVSLMMLVDQWSSFVLSINQLLLSKFQIREGIHIYFFLFLHKNICCGYSLEALTEALLMSTHNICFCGKSSVISVLFVEKKCLTCNWSFDFCFFFPPKYSFIQTYPDIFNSNKIAETET